jgi:predicted nucleic acid-binding protein
MTSTVYVETSVVSYLTAFPTRDVAVLAHQQLTREWWNRRAQYELFISQAVLDEAGAGDPEAAARRMEAVRGISMLEVTSAVLEIAKGFIESGVLPTKALIDSIHVATAAVHGIDYLLTWNCKHIANAAIRGKIERSCRALGLQPPLICTPEELVE